MVFELQTRIVCDLEEVEDRAAASKVKELVLFSVSFGTATENPRSQHAILLVAVVAVSKDDFWVRT
jgi:hypothetical protein